jgi:hypothetical protein
MPLMELRDRADGRPGYFLDGREVRIGASLDYLTPLGWVTGTFEWSGSAYSWARLVVSYPEGGNEPMVVVIAPDARCRWPIERPLPRVAAQASHTQAA